MTDTLRGVRGRRSGKWVEEFEQWLADLKREAPAETPIPTSRDIAGRYGVAHTSVFRQLQRLEARGEVWKAESGRFYFPEARSAVQKPRPIACLFRRIENWSALYREIMEGIAEGCQQQELGSLLWHENVLVRHDDPGHPPVFATTARQGQSLTRFVERYGGDIGGLILDHVWTDRALARLPDELRKQAVLLCRPTSTDIPAIHQDFPMAAHLALVHLLAAGYDQIHPVRPFSHDPAVDHSLKALSTAAQKGEARHRLGETLSAETPAERAAIISSLLKKRQRCALVFPEDNIAALFHQECVQRGLACPEQIGILSLQGTRTAAEAQLSHVRTDYALLGRLAVQACLRLTAEKESLTPRLVQGITTRRTND